MLLICETVVSTIFTDYGFNFSVSSSFNEVSACSSLSNNFRKSILGS